MYMDEATRREVLAEAARVLRKGGLMHIWDMEFDTYPAKVHLDIVLPGQNLHADYEVHCSGRGVSLDQIRAFGDEAGLLLLMHRDNAGQISLCFQKPKELTAAAECVILFPTQRSESKRRLRRSDPKAPAKGKGGGKNKKIDQRRSRTRRKERVRGPLFWRRKGYERTH